MNILISGDLVPTEKNKELFMKGDIDSLLGKELISLWNDADMRIFNLEVPLTDNPSPIKKCGPNLIAPIGTVNGIKELNPTLLTLANNHILDQGVQGLKSTIEILKENDIPFVGAGMDLKEASRPFFIEYGNHKIGIYACAENEFSIATKSSPGANPFDPLESLDHIKNMKDVCDYVIVLYHGGKEHYRYPSPNLQRVCRKLAEKGADLIVCQHSHCIGCFEEHEESIIVYGQGNFIFDKYDNEYWNTSLIINVKIEEELTVDFIPVERKERGIRKAEKAINDKILTEFYKRSEEIKQDGFVEKKYNDFSLLYKDYYLRNLSGFGKWKSRFDRKLFKGLLIKNKFNRDQLLAIQNYIECEAHRELLLAGLKGVVKSE